MAALIKVELGLEPEIVPGATGEFSVWADGRKLIAKGLFGFPSDQKCVQAVKKACR
ncbi:MAG: hypothetical protein AB1758_04395 [Candidatus Eremiobacterota bacterium]